MEILVKEELCQKVVEVGRKSDKVMSVVLVFEKEVMRVIVHMGPKQEDQTVRKVNCIMKLHVSGVFKTLVK